MIFEIPIAVSAGVPDGHIGFDVELDGATYRMHLTFAASSQLWYLDLYLQTQSERTPIVQGCALVSGVPLLAEAQVAHRPAGELLMIGTRDAGRDDLGSHVRMYYYDAEELARVRA